MIVDLNVLVVYISAPYEGALNIQTGECRYLEASEQEAIEAEIKRDELLLPKMTYDELRALYLQELPDSEWKRKLRGSMKTGDFAGAASFAEFFHCTITDAGKYGNWRDFAEHKKREIGKRWCEENNLAFTIEKKRLAPAILAEQLKELQAQGKQPRINKELKIDLRELVQYMRRGFAGTVLNVDTGECRYACSSDGKAVEPQIRRNEVVLPHLDFGEFAQSYVQQLEDKKARKVLMDKIKGDNRGAFFQEILSSEEDAADWLGFSHKEEVKFAKSWCEKNGIGYDSNSGELNFCMNFSNADILEYLAKPAEKNHGAIINISAAGEDNAPRDTGVTISSIGFDGEDENIFVSFYGYLTSLIVLNEEFMFFDDNEKKYVSSSDTYANVVYEGATRGKSHQEILTTIYELYTIVKDATELKFEETVFRKVGLHYPQCNYVVHMETDSNEKGIIQFENIKFVINQKG